MGFEYAPKEYHLTFEDTPDLAGLEVTASSLPIGLLMRMQVLMAPAGPEVGAEEGAARVEEALSIFAAHLVSWNVTSGGQPAGTDLAAVKTQDSGLVYRVIARWWRDLEAVPAPLPDASGPGPNADLEASIPMEPLSPNPPS